MTQLICIFVINLDALAVKLMQILMQTSKYCSIISELYDT
jgi:hypothetical protein